MLKLQIEELLLQALNKLNIHSDTAQLTHPAVSAHGDFASGIAMKYAKQLNTSPLDLAHKIVQSIPANDLIERAEVVKPGFINIFIKHKVLIDELRVISRSDNYGKAAKRNGKTVIVEFSSPNIAKPFTIGHLRSTIIGDSISRILEFVGFDVKKDNHIGDWGTQFGKLIYAIKEWGSMDDIEQSEEPIRELVKLYVRFHEEAEKNELIEDKAREWFKRLEEKDAEAISIWQKCIDWSWKEFDRIYAQLNISFTENNGRGYGESFFQDKLADVLDELNKKKLLKKSEGAQIVEFDHQEFSPLMIVKQDGASLYSTRDLATDKYRLHTYGSDVIIINEVGAEQTLYFRQLYTLERILGWISDGQRKHVAHGLYRFRDSKMSTRKGNTIWLQDVISEAVRRAHELNKNGEADSSEQIAIAALKWNDLKRSAHLDVIFDWDEIVSMEGNSGPYMLYTYVRIQSVLKQVQGENTFNDVVNGGEQEEEKAVLRLLYQFPEVVESAAQSFAPHLIAQYLFTLAQAYNLLYQKLPILKAEPADRRFRLALSRATGKIIKTGLDLLGIKTVAKM